MKRGTVRVHYGTPIPTSGHTLRTKEELMALVRRAMLTQLGQSEAYPNAPGAAGFHEPESHVTPAGE